MSPSSSRQWGCNRSATVAVGSRLSHSAASAAVASILMLLAGGRIAARQEPQPPAADPVESPSTPPKERRATGLADIAKFLGGGALGLGSHEAAHLAADWAFGASPGIKKVTFGPLPFFAITHPRLSPRREFVVSSAGFWMQHATSEIILSTRPRLRQDREPVLKGWLAFNVLASAAYAGGAMARAGPLERDTRSMAEFLDVPEGTVGLMLLAPAVLDTVRFYKPDARWAVWASRAAKAGMVLLVMKRGR